MTKPLLDAFRAAPGGMVPESTPRSADRSSVTADHAGEAVRRCVEAAMGGARAMVATAGSALASCGEEIGPAQWGEVPMVLVHCQHLGPPTRPVTGDDAVTLARHMSPGSLPLPVLAASDAASAYRLTALAFHLAERLCTPVVMLTSIDISRTSQAVDLRAIDLLPPPSGPAPNTTCSTGVSPVSSQRSMATLAEMWDAVARDPERLATRLTHLRDKIEKHRDLLDVVAADVDPDAETLIISYGLAGQAARQAVALVRDAGARVSHLTVHSLWPLPEQAIRRALTPFVRRVLMPELNLGMYAAELARVIRTVKIESILRYDGRQFDPKAIARRVTDWPCG